MPTLTRKISRISLPGPTSIAGLGGNGAVGIFHETYVVKQGTYECVYANMPAFGLAAAGEMVPAIGRMQGAKSRMTGSDS